MAAMRPDARHLAGLLPRLVEITAKRDTAVAVPLSRMCVAWVEYHDDDY